MPTFRNLRTSAIAIATILAMLLVPACGSLCAAMNHCASGANPSNSDACHHPATSFDAGSNPLSLSSQTSCGQQSPLTAILAAPESSLQLKYIEAVIAPFSVIPAANTVGLGALAYSSSSSKDSPQRNIPLENISVLRI